MLSFNNVFAAIAMNTKRRFEDLVDLLFIEEINSLQIFSHFLNDYFFHVLRDIVVKCIFVTTIKTNRENPNFYKIIPINIVLFLLNFKHQIYSHRSKVNEASKYILRVTKFLEAVKYGV